VTISPLQRSHVPCRAMPGHLRTHANHCIHLDVFGGTKISNCTCKAGALPLEPHFQPLFALVIFQIGCWVLPGLASNLDAPGLYLLNSWDYRCETPGLAFIVVERCR
jgi:hypothetical protein